MDMEAWNTDIAHTESGEERVLHDMFKAECAKDFVAFTSYIVDALESA
jgi:hypothetical protein